LVVNDSDVSLDVASAKCANPLGGGLRRFPARDINVGQRASHLGDAGKQALALEFLLDGLLDEFAAFARANLGIDLIEEIRGYHDVRTSLCLPGDHDLAPSVLAIIAHSYGLCLTLTGASYDPPRVTEMDVPPGDCWAK
jgi:hypothetical protein